MAQKRLSALISIGGAVAGSLKSAIGQTQAGISRIGTSVQQLTARQRELNNVVAAQGKLGASASALKVQYAQQELAVIDKQISKLKQRQALEAKAISLRQRRQEVGGAIRESVTVGTVAALPLLGAMKQSMEYQYQLQLIGNTANMTKAEIAAMSAKIMQSSKDTNQSATNTTKAMGFLVAAGMDMGTAQRTLNTVGKTATATGGDVEDMAKAAFTLNDSLKISPERMNETMGMLATAGKLGNVEMRDMAKQFPVLGSGFVALKMQGQEAAVTIGAALQIARKGAADADEAANNMKNFNAKILSPETLKKAKKMGLDLYQVITNAQKHGLNAHDAAIEAIMKTTKGDQKALGEIFGDMQVQNYLRPMMQNWSEYKRIKAEALAGGGAIDTDFARMMSTDKEQIDKLGGAVQRFGIVLGGALAQTFGGQGGLAERIDGVTKWIDANRELVGTVVQVGAAVLGGRLAFNVLRYSVLGVQSIVVGTRIAFAAMPAVLGAVATGLRVAGTAALFVGRALLLNPIGLAVTAIAVAAFLIYKNWEPLKAFFAGLWDSVKATFSSAIDWIMGKVATFFAVIDKVKAGAVAIGNAIGTRIAQTNAAMAADGMAFDATGMPTGIPLPTPVMAGSRSAVTNNSTTNVGGITVNAPAGADAKEIAREVDSLLKRQNAVDRRSRMYDGATQ